MSWSRERSLGLPVRPPLPAALPPRGGSSPTGRPAGWRWEGTPGTREGEEEERLIWGRFCCRLLLEGCSGGQVGRVPSMRSPRGCEVTEPHGVTPAVATDRSACGHHCSSRSSSSSMVRAHGAMVPARRHLLLILLLVALHARAARAAPWRARQADEDDGSPYPASQLDVALDPLEQPGDPLQVDGFPTYWPLPVLNPESRPTDEDDGSPYPASQLDVALDPLEQPGDPLQVDGFPTYWPLPVLNPESRPTAVPTGEGNVASRMGSGDEPPQAGAVLSEPGEDRHGRVYAVNRMDSGEVEKTPARASSTQRIVDHLCPQDVRQRCMISTAAIMLSVPVAIVVCCIVIHRYMKKNERSSAAPGAQRDTRSYPSHPDSWSSRPSTPEGWTRQYPPSVYEKPVRAPSQQPPRPPPPRSPPPRSPPPRPAPPRPANPPSPQPPFPPPPPPLPPSF
ncbi:uncharacterized protein [Nyctibius grandis]|uniref:uncharacterized protein isoform X1 n=1 Tax=Nyctibius grandis TaxID=48427 RepID=UPI0035BBE843